MHFRGDFSHLHVPRPDSVIGRRHRGSNVAKQCTRVRARDRHSLRHRQRGVPRRAVVCQARCPGLRRRQCSVVGRPVERRHARRSTRTGGPPAQTLSLRSLQGHAPCDLPTIDATRVESSQRRPAHRLATSGGDGIGRVMALRASGCRLHRRAWPTLPRAQPFGRPRARRQQRPGGARRAHDPPSSGGGGSA